MQSKIVIGILTLVALTCLTAFASITVIDIKDTQSEEKKLIENTKLLSIGEELKNKTDTLQSTLVQLRLEREDINVKIFNQKRILGDLNTDLTNYENKKNLLIKEIEGLNSQKLELKNITEKINNEERLLGEVSQLEIRNHELKAEMAKLKAINDEAVLNLSETLNDLNEELDRTNKKIILDSTTQKKEIFKLKQKLKLLNTENTKNLKLLEQEKKIRLEELKFKNSEKELVRRDSQEIKNLKDLKSNFEQLNGLRVIFSGNMIYDESKSQIVFRADNSIGIPIFQDDFTGSIAGKCGLPVDKEIQNRCSATIIAEFVVEDSRLFLRGKEIVEVVRK